MRVLRLLLIALIVVDSSYAQESSDRSVPQEMGAGGIEAPDITEPDADEIERANDGDQESLAALKAVREGNDFWRSGEIERSSASYQRAINLDPSFYSAQFNFGLTLLHSKQYGRAVLAFTQALRLRPGSASAWQNLGFAHHQRKHYEKGVDAFREAQQLAPDEPATNSNLGFAYLYARRYQEAIVSFQNALQLDPEFSPAINGLCSVQALAKKPGTVEACLKAAATYPNSAVPHYFLGVAYIDLGKPEKALSPLQKAARIEPWSPRILVALGFACFKLEEYGAASKHFENATTLDMKAHYALTGLGVTYAQLKEYEKAESVLRQAVSFDPDNLTASFNLGIVCLIRRNRDCALSQYNRLKKMDHPLAKSLFTTLFRDRILDASAHEKP